MKKKTQAIKKIETQKKIEISVLERILFNLAYLEKLSREFYVKEEDKFKDEKYYNGYVDAINKIRKYIVNQIEETNVLCDTKEHLK